MPSTWGVNCRIRTDSLGSALHPLAELLENLPNCLELLTNCHLNCRSCRQIEGEVSGRFTLHRDMARDTYTQAYVPPFIRESILYHLGGKGRSVFLVLFNERNLPSAVGWVGLKNQEKNRRNSSHFQSPPDEIPRVFRVPPTGILRIFSFKSHPSSLRGDVRELMEPS